MSQNSVGINQNFNAFIEYTQQSFLKDTIVLYRPYEKPIRIPIVKDYYGYKATYKGFFEYKEELLRKDGHFTGRVFLKVFTDYRFRLEIEHSFVKTKEEPFFMIPGVLYGSKNQTEKPMNLDFNYGKSIGKYLTADIQVRADRSSHPSIITIKNNQVLMVACQEAALGNDTIHRVSVFEPLYPYNGIFVYTSDQKFDKIGFSIGYKHIPFRNIGNQTQTNSVSFDSSHTEGWIEKKMGKVLSFKTLYYISNARERIESYDKALRCFYKEFHEEPVPKVHRSKAIVLLKEALLAEVFRSNEKKNSYKNYNFSDTTNTSFSGFEAVFPLLKAALKTNDVVVLDTITKYANNLCENLIKNTDNQVATNHSIKKMILYIGF